MVARKTTRTHHTDKRKILIVDGVRYDIPLSFFGEVSFSISEFQHNPRKFKAIVLTGGADINPAIYGHRMHERGGIPDLQRDARDLSLLQLAIANKVPVVGICRGAQLINVLAGGWLVQDCDNHIYWHEVRTYENKLLDVSSTHHQMMVPPRQANHEVLAWAEPRLSTYYNGGVQGGKGIIAKKYVKKEVDCIFFPNIRALAMQYHPEYMEADSAGFNFALKLIRDKLELKLVKNPQKAAFISLPKEPTSLRRDKAQEDELKALKTKVQQVALLENRWKLDFLQSRTRIYQARFFGQLKSKIKAKEDLNEYKKIWEKMQSEAKEKINMADGPSPVRAAKVSA